MGAQACLVDRVWMGEPPIRAKDTLHSYLTRLRRALPEVTIARRGASYVATVEQAACARLTGHPVPQVRTILRTLERVSLVQ